MSSGSITKWMYTIADTIIFVKVFLAKSNALKNEREKYRVLLWIILSPFNNS